jgi:hypothetical protein
MNASNELQAYWKSQVAEFLQSGLDRKTYCQQKNIKMHQLDYWKAKLKARPPAIKKVDASPQWVTLQVADKFAGSAGIRLRIGRLAIEVDSGFSRETLADVLKVAAAIC